MLQSSMPCVSGDMAWLSFPLQVVEQLAQPGEIQEFFREKASSQLQAIPNLGQVPLGELREGQLVRWRCMVQVGTGSFLQ